MIPAQDALVPMGPQAAHICGLWLEDQQLGGLILWVPGGTVYVAVALMLAARALRVAARRAVARIADASATLARPAPMSDALNP